MYYDEIYNYLKIQTASTEKEKQQMRCLITAYCLCNDVIVDSKEYNTFMKDMYDDWCCFSELDTLDKFKEYMSEFLE